MGANGKEKPTEVILRKKGHGCLVDDRSGPDQAGGPGPLQSTSTAGLWCLAQHVALREASPGCPDCKCERRREGWLVSLKRSEGVDGVKGQGGVPGWQGRLAIS